MSGFLTKKITTIVLICGVLSPTLIPITAYAGPAEVIGPPAEQNVPSPWRGYVPRLLDKYFASQGITDGSTTEKVGQLITGIGTGAQAGLLKIAGTAADIAIGYSILGTINGSSIYKASIITEGWTIFRDLINVIFIFIVIYIGLSTILGLMGGNMKQLLARVIIVAILINFSLVLTGVIIDAGNIMALSFYNAFPESSVITDGRSLSSPFMQGSGFSRFFGTEAFQTFTGFFKSLSLSITGGSVVMIIATFVLFAVALLFLIRTAVLWFLLIISPVAFAAFILPNTQTHAFRWFNTLLSNVFWAPAFLALFYVAAKIFLSDAFVVMANASYPAGAVLSFAMVAILTILSLTISKSMGAYGASTVTSYTQKKLKATGWAASGFAGRHTVGRAASSIANSDRIKSVLGESRFGTAALKPFKYVGGASFGGKKGGYDKALENQAKDFEKQYKDLKYGKDGQYLGGPVHQANEYGELQYDSSGKPIYISRAQDNLLKTLNRPTMSGIIKGGGKEPLNLTPAEQRELNILTGKQKLTSEEQDDLKRLYGKRREYSIWENKLRKRSRVSREAVKKIHGKKDIRQEIIDEAKDRGDVVDKDDVTPPAPSPGGGTS